MLESAQLPEMHPKDNRQPLSILEITCIFMMDKKNYRIRTDDGDL